MISFGNTLAQNHTHFHENYEDLLNIRVMKYMYNVCYFMELSSDTHDISALDGYIFFNVHPIFVRHSLSTISARWSTNINCGCSHLPHCFHLTSNLIHHQSVDSHAH